MKKLYPVILLFLIPFPLLGQLAGFYNGAEGKTGSELKSALHEIINGHIDFSYPDAKYIINYSDADPANESNVILFYTQRSQDADTYGSGVNDINREHVWAKSHGGFADVRPMDGDAFNLRPTDASVNIQRSNLDFDECSSTGTLVTEAPGTYFTTTRWEPADAVKGQVARILFYMATRYEGTNEELDLEVVDEVNTYPNPEHGKLSTLLQWNRDFPPTDFERHRNERIFQSQQNRNPFIDYPEFADMIWNSEPAPEIFIGEMDMAPLYPLVGETAEISVRITSNLPLTEVVLFWGDTYDSENNKVAMSASGDIYSGSIDLAGFPEDDYIYFKVGATDGTNDNQIYGSYRIPKDISEGSLTTIPDIQGTGSASPLESDTITTSGYVIANFDNTMYIQSSTNPFSGMCIYGSNQRGFVGDSIVITAEVDEYNDLTELTNVTYVYHYPLVKEIEPVDLTVSQVSEDYEGMLIRFRNIQFSNGGVTIPGGSETYTFSDGTGSMVIYSRYGSRLVGNQLPSGNIDLTGILSQYQGNYQILVRDMSDFTQVSSFDSRSFSDKSFEIFPNPNEGQFSIRLHLMAKSQVDLQIFDITGKAILERTVEFAEGINTYRLDDAKIPSGIYFVRIVAEGTVHMQKMVVK